MKNLLAALFLAFACAACHYDSEEELYGPVNPAACDTTAATYNITVKPIINRNHCLECHNGAGASGGIDLSTYSGVRGVAVNQRLLGAIRHQAPYQAMPRGYPQLTDCEINQISRWVSSGTPEN